MILQAESLWWILCTAYGDCDGTVDGMEAVEAYMMALEDEQPYDLICLDVMMPVMDGYQVLNTIRNMEKQRGIEGDDRVKIIMMTALNEQKNSKKRPLKWAARFIVRSRLIWIN